MANTCLAAASFIAALLLLSCAPAGQGTVSPPKLPESPTGYYAVYMASNNVVLIGKIDRTEGEYITLSNVYYIRSNVDRSTGEVSNKIVKRNMEWHQPATTMIHIPHAMIIEPVTSGSRVMELINQAK